MSIINPKLGENKCLILFYKNTSVIITALAVLLLMAVSIPVFADSHEATTETEETSEGTNPMGGHS